MTVLSTFMRALSGLGRGFGGIIVRRRPASGGVELATCERLIQRILSSIHNNSILLCGAPGTGKTTLLFQLKERLATGGDDPTTDFFPVYMDLRGIPENLLFATVARAVLGQLGLSPAGRAVGFAAVYDHRDLASDFRNVIRTLKTRSSRRARLVLLVDGIDELNTYDPRTTQRVRSLFMASLAENMVMVASAVEIDKHWEQEGSPWYNFFEEIEISSSHREQRRPG